MSQSHSRDRRRSRREFLIGGGLIVAGTTVGCGKLPSLLLPGWYRTSGEKPGNQPQISSLGVKINAIGHAINRLTFGPRPGDYARIRKLGGSVDEAAANLIEEQLAPESIADSSVEALLARLPSLIEPLGELFEYHEHVLLRELVHGTLLRAVHSERQLYEVMVHFWTDHFNIDPSKGDSKWLKVWDDREVIRKFALGGHKPRQLSAVESLAAWAGFAPENNTVQPATFKDMVRASALSPAMLWYLDGRENRKRAKEDRPNENYARELLELHTLGVNGGYTQQDVMEVARCLTGWTVRPRSGGFLRFAAGKVEFNKSLHDDAAKIVLGHRIPPGLGAADLDRVIEIVATHPATANYLATKLCRRFIADDPPRSAVEIVAAAFSKSGGDIRATLRALFRSEEFAAAAGRKIRRPFHFMAAALRASGARLRGTCDKKNDGSLHRLLRSMGHLPFEYPTPDGYPEESAPWLGTMLWRWKFALNLASNRIPEARLDRGPSTRPDRSFAQLAASALGRRLEDRELAALKDLSADERWAVLLASPGFQRC